MKKWTKTVLAVSLSLLCVGGFAAGVGAATGGSLRFSINLLDGLDGYTDLSREEEKELAHVDVAGKPDKIVLYLESGDLTICPTDGNQIYLESKLTVDCSVVDGVMQVTAKVPGGNHFFGINADLPDSQTGLTLYLPQDWELGEIEIHSYGDLRATDVRCARLTVEQENGDMTGENLTCGRVEIDNEYGDVKLTGLTCDGLEVSQENGGFQGQGLSCGSLELENDYSDVNLEDAALGVAVMELENGDINLTALTVSDRLTIESDYGDVNVEMVEGAEAYSWDFATEYGDVTVAGTTYNGGVMNHWENAPLLTVRSENGDIRVK